MIRHLLSATAAILLIAAPVAASAATTAKPARTTMAKPTASKTPKAGKRMAARATPRRADGGNAAVDALNEQSLARARGGQ